MAYFENNNDENYTLLLKLKIKQRNYSDRNNLKFDDNNNKNNNNK